MRNKFDEDHILSICKPGDYIVTPPMKAQIAVDELRRYFLGEEITESDKVFYHEGLLAKFIDEPKIEVNLNEEIEN